MDLTEGHFTYLKNIHELPRASGSLCPVSVNIYIQFKRWYIKKTWVAVFWQDFSLRSIPGVYPLWCKSSRNNPECSQGQWAGMARKLGWWGGFLAKAHVTNSMDPHKSSVPVTNASSRPSPPLFGSFFSIGHTSVGAMWPVWVLPWALPLWSAGTRHLFLLPA